MENTGSDENKADKMCYRCYCVMNIGKGGVSPLSIYYICDRV